MNQPKPQMLSSQSKIGKFIFPAPASQSFRPRPSAPQRPIQLSSQSKNVIYNTKLSNNQNNQMNPNNQINQNNKTNQRKENEENIQFDDDELTSIMTQMDEEEKQTRKRMSEKQNHLLV